MALERLQKLQDRLLVKFVALTTHHSEEAVEGLFKKADEYFKRRHTMIEEAGKEARRKGEEQDKY